MSVSRFAPPAEVPGLAARRIAADILDGVLHKRRTLDDQLDGAAAHIGLRTPADRDRALMRRLVATALRRLGTLRHVLSRLLDRGLPGDAPAFVRMLGDIVLQPVFPVDELERERQVILHEYVEDEDDALSVGFRLFDKLSFGAHPLAQPVIGQRRCIERLTRDDLLAYVQRQYSAANTVVAVAGDVDAEAIVRAAEQAFGAMPQGSDNRVAPPQWLGGLRTRALAGSPQTHVVLGFPLPALGGPHQAGVVAAALLGEGMSSPLMDQLRERRGLVYYAACSADVLELAGQFVIEASTSPQQLPEFFAEVVRLLLEQSEGNDATALERARRQIVVRELRALERPSRRLEAAALDLFARVRPRRDDGRAGRRQCRAGARHLAAMLDAGAISVAGNFVRGPTTGCARGAPEGTD